MDAVSKILKRLASIIVDRYARRLEIESGAKRGLSHALLQVEPSQTSLFELQIPSLAKTFDVVQVAWPLAEKPARLPNNVHLFTPTDGYVSRWQLLPKCEAGFVFPISLIKPIRLTHASHLKRHLFAAGGASAVGLVNLHSAVEASELKDESALNFVPMPILDLDYAIFDQRFWKLTGEEIDLSNESLSFANLAQKRNFSLYACHDSLAQALLTKPTSQNFSRLDLIESALKIPRLVTELDPSALQVWVKAWDSIGAKNDGPAAAEVQEALVTLLAKNELLAGKSKAAARKLLGRTAKPQGARS